MAIRHTRVAKIIIVSGSLRYAQESASCGNVAGLSREEWKCGGYGVSPSLFAVARCSLSGLLAPAASPSRRLTAISPGGEVWERGDGLGYNVSLTLGTNGRVSFARWMGCLGEYGRAEGTWSDVDGGVELTPSPFARSTWRSASRPAPGRSSCVRPRGASTRFRASLQWLVCSALQLASRTLELALERLSARSRWRFVSRRASASSVCSSATLLSTMSCALPGSAHAPAPPRRAVAAPPPGRRAARRARGPSSRVASVRAPRRLRVACSSALGSASRRSARRRGLLRRPGPGHRSGLTRASAWRPHLRTDRRSPSSADSRPRPATSACADAPRAKAINPSQLRAGAVRPGAAPSSTSPEGQAGLSSRRQADSPYAGDHATPQPLLLYSSPCPPARSAGDPADSDASATDHYDRGVPDQTTTTTTTSDGPADHHRRDHDERRHHHRGAAHHHGTTGPADMCQGLDRGQYARPRGCLRTSSAPARFRRLQPVAGYLGCCVRPIAASCPRSCVALTASRSTPSTTPASRPDLEVCDSMLRPVRRRSASASTRPRTTWTPTAPALPAPRTSRRTWRSSVDFANPVLVGKLQPACPPAVVTVCPEGQPDVALRRRLGLHPARLRVPAWTMLPPRVSVIAPTTCARRHRAAR